MGINAIGSGLSAQESIDMEQAYNDANYLPPNLEAAAKKNYDSCNVNAYIAKFGIAHEAFHNNKLYMKLHEVKELRDNFAAITNMLMALGDQLDDPKKQKISLDYSLHQKLKELLPDPLTAKTEWTRVEAQRLRLMLTRHSEGEITPKIQEMTAFEIPQIIEDWHKIFQILKELMKAYDDLINRINGKPK